jgi:hypothetical protein
MATKKHFFTFTVEGAGEFPMDMLRYDRCFPRNEKDANAAQDRERGRRQVELTRPHCEAYWTPTEGRWQSFGWKVVAGARETYV